MPGQLSGMIFGTAAGDMIGANDMAASLSGDAWLIHDMTVGGNDNLAGSAGSDFLSGDAGDSLRGFAVGGSDILYGGAGIDLMKGDAQVMEDSAIGGNDALYGGDGDDRMQGDAWASHDGASGGNDVLYGGAGNDYIYGDFLEYYGFGAGGNDQLFGGDGNDSLSGGRGADLLTGGAGADLFKLINYGDGTDHFTDFNAAEGDRIELEGFGVTFADLDSNGNGVADEGDQLIYVKDGSMQIDMTAYNTSPIAGNHLAIVDGVTAVAEQHFVIIPFS